MKRSGQDRFGVFWYNDDEIFRWDDADFERKAAEFAAAMVNIVMTFSCTHFRWNYYLYWALLNRTLAKLVRACRRYGIRVVEHHSCHLTFAPRDRGEWEYAEKILRQRRSSLDSFPGLREAIAAGDPEIAPGKYLSTCRQIDGRTGEYARTGYHGYALCFNNPDYRKAYFDYLESVYRTGVDGIMTDDVHFFGSGNACACQYCREKFRAASGYELPPPDAWGKFAGNYRDPAYIAWLRFRFASTVEFQEAVTAHAEGLGYKMLRPNYTTSTFTVNRTAYPFEQAGHLWSTVFQENMFSSVMRASWPSWCADAAHRRAMAGKYGVAPMSMFYPSRADDYYFCWALSRQWEHLLMATPEGGDLNEIERKFASYEAARPRWVQKAVQPAQIAFLQPREAMDFTEDAVESAARPFNVFLQGAVFRNLSFTILFEDEPLERWREFPLVVVAGATMLSDDRLERMAQYCRAGGKLLIFGAFGTYRPDGSLREHPEKILGLEADLSDWQAVPAGEMVWNNRTVPLPAVAESRVLKRLSGDAQVIARGEDGSVYGVAALRGRCVWLTGGVRCRGLEAVHYPFVIPRWGSAGQAARENAPAYAADELYRVPGALLTAVLGETPALQVSNRDYQISLYHDPSGSRYRFYLVNVAGLLAHPPEKISHGDIFRNFTENAPANRETVELIFQKPEKFIPPETVTAYSPEFPGGRSLTFATDEKELRIRIAPGTFSGYLEIEL